MDGTDARPIVAVFAKAPHAGEVKTRLCPPLSPVEAAARGAFAFTPVEDEAYFAGLAPAFLRVAQLGEDLGERMRGALEALLATGAPAVVLLGADAPTLPRAFVADALVRLAQSDVDVVLGPTEDGGYCLVGVKHAHPELFDGIPWSTPAVLDETLARAATAGLTVSLLPPWFDVDTAADLERPGVREVPA